MEGGNVWREGSVEYDGFADARGAARFFYYSLNEGAAVCSKNVPDTASGTPVSFNGVWIIGDCSQKLLGFVYPDKLTASGGKLTPAWTWSPPAGSLPGGFVLPEPRFATPVIDSTSGVLYALLKWEGDAQLYALQLNTGTAAPTLLWNLDLGKIDVKNSNGVDAVFQNWAEDHAIFLYGGKVWIPSLDFDGALIVDVNNVSPDPVQPYYAVTEGQWSDNHRLLGSVGSRGGGWTKPVFVLHAWQYGFQQFDPETGNGTSGCASYLLRKG